MVQVCIGLLLSAPLQAGLNVVASIAPVHSLLAGVMEGVGTQGWSPKLLIPVGQSPHDYALRPSAVKDIYHADLIVWIGSDYETALSDVIGDVSTQASKQHVVKSLSSVRELKAYPVRTGAFWEPDSEHENEDNEDDDHQDGHAEQHPRYIDSHFWLSTTNAKIMVKLFRTWLTEIDPANTPLYQRNAERLMTRIDRLQSHLQQQLQSVTASPYLVFHDAYQYFEKQFKLNPLGSITLNPTTPPGVKRIQAIRKMIAVNGVKCLFNEPQFESKLIPTLIENTDVRLGQLDPLGTHSQLGVELWFEIMAEMGQSLSDCLL